jgi:hypothetical protein
MRQPNAPRVPTPREPNSLICNQPQSELKAWVSNHDVEMQLTAKIEGSADIAGFKPENTVRLLASAQSDAETSVLTYFSRSWVAIADQIRRYVEIVRAGA